MRLALKILDTRRCRPLWTKVKLGIAMMVQKARPPKDYLGGNVNE